MSRNSAKEHTPMRTKIAMLAAGALVLALAACGNGSGENSDGSDFPAGKQVTIVVPYSAGGASDLTARAYAQELEKELDTSVVVTNVTGSSGAIGLEQVRSSKADGYTIAYMPVESAMLKALGFTDLSTDDFTFLGRVMTIPAAVTVRADSPWDSYEDFADYAREHPGEIQVGNSGTGSIWHVAAASIEQEEDVEFTHVPFDGAAPAVAALVGGNIQAVTVSPSEVQSSVESGELKVLTVLGDERSSILPDVPTASELGVDLTVQGWGGFAVPKDTPDEVVAVLQDASGSAMNSDSVVDFLAERGYEHAYLSGPDMDAAAAEDLARFSELIPRLGIVNS
ncbi:tripartite tricarboxylate transporter substrate binding protein [Actinobaculum sp. 313]|nr:tripartite tricarboxylate transporter substrate binding protein [Actinobaculum sp. 313]